MGNVIQFPGGRNRRESELQAQPYDVSLPSLPSGNYMLRAHTNTGKKWVADHFGADQFGFGAMPLLILTADAETVVSNARAAGLRCRDDLPQVLP